MLNIVLFEPEIPQNTGNIARTCVATKTKLHLVHPLGFTLDEKAIRRSGLDYWPDLELTEYKDTAEFLNQHQDKKIYFFSTKASKSYDEVKYEDNAYFVFGKESAGIKEEILVQYPDNVVRLPMISETRSLNLSNAVAIATYEYYRQKSWPDQFKKFGNLHRLDWNKKKIGFVGFGNMAKAIAYSLKDNYQVHAFDINKDQFNQVDYDLRIEEDIPSLVKNSDVVVISVKPQIVPSVLSQLKGANAYISIAAGISIEYLKKELENANIVRFMPNIAAKDKKAITAVSYKEADKEFVEEAIEIANSFGTHCVIEEELISSFIGISGSAIAYVFDFAKHLAAAGSAMGINAEDSLAIVKKTIEGAVSIMNSETTALDDLVKRVCSPGGTTIEGIKTLEANEFGTIIAKAAKAAADRNIELEKK